jgi:aspartate/glutamate racemase
VGLVKRIGLIGGIGPESTIAYYRAIMAAGRAIAPTCQPPVLINSIDVQTVLRLAIARWIEAVVLVGTEVPLLLTDVTAASVPLLDTTDIHVTAAVKLASS